MDPCPSTTPGSLLPKISPLYLIASAFVLVAGLAWNQVIQTLLQKYGPQDPQAALKSQIIYAVVITIIFVIVIYILEHIHQRTFA